MQPLAENLPKIYLGERTGERVLAGQAKRGDGERFTLSSGCATCGTRRDWKPD